MHSFPQYANAVARPAGARGYRVTCLICCKAAHAQFNMGSFPIIQVTEGEQRSLRLWDVLGVKIPEYFTKHPALLADYISNFETRPDDVFVVSYPKSGSCIFIVILSKSDN